MKAKKTSKATRSVASEPGEAPVRVQPVVSGHLRDLHKFIEHIMAYAEEPANWPLTQQEQAAFVRTVIFQARKLRKSEGYVTTALVIAAEELAMAS